MKTSVKYLKILCNMLRTALILFVLLFVLPKCVVYFFPFVVGFVLACIANPVVRFLEKKIKIKRKYSTVLMIVTVITVIVFLCNGLVTLLSQGIRSFMEYLPTMYENAGAELTSAINQIEKMIQGVPFGKTIPFDKYETVIQDFLKSSVSGSGGSTADTIGSVAKQIPHVFVGAIVGLLATYFFIVEREQLLHLVKEHTPQPIREKCKMIYDQIVVAVWGYFKAQFKIMFVIYLLLVIGFVIIGVDYAWLIGFGVAFLDMLPIFGVGTVLLPWALVKVFSGNYIVAIGMLVLYVICLVTHHILQPKLVGDSVGMDPFATLFFMYLGYRISGVVGMIIAIPFGMILINLYKAGTFDTFIWCIKEVVNDFEQFRKIDHK